MTARSLVAANADLQGLHTRDDLALNCCDGKVLYRLMQVRAAPLLPGRVIYLIT